MKYTDEQKREFVLEAIQNFREAQKMVEQGRRLMKRAGVEIGCSADVIDKYYHGGEDTDGGLMIYGGLKKLAKLLGAETFTPEGWDGRKDRSRIACKAAGIYFFQLGDETRTNFKFR